VQCDRKKFVQRTLSSECNKI